MARILAVGIATLDIVSEVETYPPEDAEVRACAQSFRRGGNATNALVVLSQLGHDCEWAGVWRDEPAAAPVLEDLAGHGIGMHHCKKAMQGSMPVSCITLNTTTGSRTIVHYRDLPEYDAGRFARIPLDELDWIHFEGRNVTETMRMMQRVRHEAPGLLVSLEVEKPRAGIERLFAFADLIVFSRAIAEHRNVEPAVLLQQVRATASRADLVCTLGERGATGLQRTGATLDCDASRPPQVVDTIGAGDSFNAGLIDARLRGATFGQALRFACRLAGNKCGQSGFGGLSVPPRDF